MEYADTAPQPIGATTVTLGRTVLGIAARMLSGSLIALCLAAVPGSAQSWLRVEGVADGEAWATDDGSRLLARNDGRPSVLGRLQLWAIAELRPDLAVLALGELEGGNALEEGHEVGIEQLVLRYARSRSLVIDVGQLVSPVGAFGSRRFSTINPLIGSPDGYPVTYPWGFQIAGAFRQLDYRAALVNLPVTHEGYVPEPSATLRPAIGAGITPTTGLRFGVSYTRGPYLNRHLGTALLAGEDWKDYRQQVIAFDSRFSRGYLELHGELGLSDYEVPGLGDPVGGIAYYAEAKYTWSPRLFTAARLERNDYPFIRPQGDNTWMAQGVNFYNFEVGAGYRLSPGTTVKVSYRRDRWLVDEAQKSYLPDGYAFAMQLSQRLDINSWFARPQ